MSENIPENLWETTTKNYPLHSDECVVLAEIIHTVAGYLKNNSQFSDFSGIDLQQENTNIPIWVDYKYFVKAIEILLEEITRHTEHNTPVSVQAILNGDNSLSISFINKSLPKQALEAISTCKFLKNTFGLHGITLQTGPADVNHAITLHIPAYRVKKQ